MTFFYKIFLFRPYGFDEVQATWRLWGPGESTPGDGDFGVMPVRGPLTAASFLKAQKSKPSVGRMLVFFSPQTSVLAFPWQHV